MTNLPNKVSEIIMIPQISGHVSVSMHPNRRRFNLIHILVWRKLIMWETQSLVAVSVLWQILSSSS